MTYDRDTRDAGSEARVPEEDLLGPELRALLDSLPKELEPESDLTASIAARTWDSRDLIAGPRSTAAPGAVPGERQRRRIARRWWSGQNLKLAAAAVALVVVTSAVTTWIVRDSAVGHNDAQTTIVEAMEGQGATFAGYSDVQNQYAEAIADLTAAVQAERDRLPPETVALIEENLQVIDGAIRESLAALRSSPESLPLQQAVMTSYERKLDFLRQAAAVTAEG
jgi:hypothetical protein